MITAGLVLFFVALALEAFGPWLMRTIFPQQLLAPAPQAQAPQKTVARNDAIVDDTMDHLAHVRKAHKREDDAKAANHDTSADDAIAPATVVAAGTAAAAVLATADSTDPVDALLAEQNFDYSEFRPQYNEPQGMASGIDLDDEIDRAMA